MRGAQATILSLTAAISVSACELHPQVDMTHKDSSMVELEQRAKFDLGCDKVENTRLATGTWGVSGCGHRAVYIWEPDRASLPGGPGKWILNSKEADPGSPAKPASSSP